MTFKRLRILGVGLLGATLLVGVACSDDTGTANDDSTASPTATSTPTSVPTEIATVVTSNDGDGIEPATPDAPPQGTLASAAGEVDLGLGTYCWSPPAASGNPALCADAIGIITAPTDLVAEAGETLTIADEEPGTLPWPPLTIDRATLWPMSGEPMDAREDYRAWQPDGGFEGGAVLEADSSEIGAHTVVLPDDLEPGRYLLAIHYTAGPDRGSEATYGAIIVIE
ncbi:MAG: hypothetical protein AB7F65_09040 [Dehalococcoidia bacterium]